MGNEETISEVVEAIEHHHRRNGDKGSYQLSVKTLATWVISIGTILGSAFAIDARYVHHEEFVNSIVDIEHRQITQEKDRVQDAVYAIEVKQKQTSEDKAQLDRFKNRIIDLSAQDSQLQSKKQ